MPPLHVEHVSRVARAAGQCRECRGLGSQPAKGKPELLATGPSQVWSWDMMELRGRAKGIWFQLHAPIDNYSRFSPGDLVCAAEDSVVAADFIDEVVVRDGTALHAMHADRGTSMTSKPVSALLAAPGGHPVPFTASGQQRQPVLRGAVQDAQVCPRLPPPLRLIGPGPGVL